MKDEDKYFLACLEEYKTLREESKQASINMISSMSIGIGIAVVATVAGISFLTDKNNSLTPQNLIFPLSLFGLIVPFLLFLITAFWLGELARFKRAGNYICFIETKISMLLNQFYKNNLEKSWKISQKYIEDRLKVDYSISELGRPLQWEIWLRSFEKEKVLSTSGHMKWIYRLRAGLLFFAFYGTIFYGFWLIGHFLTIGLLQLSFGISVLITLMIIMAIIYLIIFIILGKQLGIKQEPIVLSELFSSFTNNK